MNPLLLVDVDGVLNPFEAKPTRRPAGYETFYKSYYDRHRGKQSKMRVWLNPEHGPMLTRFAQDNGFELAWCTTWEDQANSWIGPKLHLTEDWPVVNFGFGDLQNVNNWKFQAVERFAAGRDLVWLDDDFKSFKSGRDRFILSRSRYSNTTLYNVDASKGLLAEDLQKIKIHVVTQWQVR